MTTPIYPSLCNEDMKKNLIAPSAMYFTSLLIFAITGSLNPRGGVLMSVVASVTDVAAAIITQNSTKKEDTNFRLVAITVIPLTLGLCIGMSFASAFLMSLTNLAVRTLLHEYCFQTNESEAK